MISKKYAKVDQKQCVACGACIKECPKGAIQIWKGCYAKIEEATCVGCGKCARTCPVGCITVVDRGEKES